MNAFDKNNLRIDNNMIFSASVSPLKENIAREKDKLTWRSSLQKGSPLTSLMKIHWGKAQKKENNDELYFSLINKPESVKSVIKVWQNHYALGDIASALAKVKTHGWNIYMTREKSEGMFLTFMELFFQQLSGKETASISQAFFEAKNKLKEFYPLPEDYNSIILVNK